MKNQEQIRQAKERIERARQDPGFASSSERAKTGFTAFAGAFQWVLDESTPLAAALDELLDGCRLYEEDPVEGYRVILDRARARREE